MRREIVFSIITVSYNSEKTIEKTIESVKKQKKSIYEYIVIDGLSSDNTLKKVEKFNSEIDIKILSERDNGIYDAMNKGLSLVNGEWVIFINSDDWLEDGILEKIFNEYNEYFKDKDIDAIYGNINKVNEYGEFIEKSVPSNNVYKDVKIGMPLFHQAVFIRSKVYNELIGFNDQFKIAGDWDFIARMINNKYNFKYIPEIISNFRIGGASVKPHIQERHNVRKKNNLYKFIDKNMYLEYLVYLKTLIFKEKKEK